MSCDREFIDYDSHMPLPLEYLLPQDSLDMYHHQQNVSPQYMHHHRPPMQQHQIPIQQHQVPTQHHQVQTQRLQVPVQQRHPIPTQRHPVPTQRHPVPTQRHQVPIQQHQISIQQHQVPIQQNQISVQQMRYPNPMQAGTNTQTEPPPLNYLTRMSGIPISNANQARPYMHPQYRAQQMHLQQQEQQRRHQQMLQQNMMNMQNHMVHRPQLRMPQPMSVSPSGRQVPIQQQPQHRTQQQWRFHNIRSLAPGWNNFSESTPPPLMPLECDLIESATPTPNSINEEQGMDDFNDFDVTDLLRLTFGDENEFSEHNSRKRKGSKSSSEYSPMKKHRRTKADIIADRNEMLMDQCREFYIPLHNHNYPDHVRIFGKNILRENLPNVPNMKLAPKNIDFYRIRNLGYLVTKKGICFSCLTDQCKFKSYELDKFKKHLNTYHHVDGCGSREGYCKLCEKHCCGFSLTDEVDHILSTHVKSVDKHPMHQILQSHTGKPTSFREPLENFQEDTSNILNNMESDMTKRCEKNKEMYLNDTYTSTESESFGPKKSKRGNRSNLLNYSIDEDYNPDLENDDEVDEEIESECDDNIDDLEDDSEPDINEFIQLTDEDDEEEEEDLVFDDTESESEESKTDKDGSEVPTTESTSKNGNTEKTKIPPEPPEPSEPPELDDIPLYMLNRIKMHQSMKGLEDEGEELKLDSSIVEAFDELMKVDNLERTPKRRKKRRQTFFARKKTSTPFAPRLNKVYSIESVKELPQCRVTLKRLENANTSIESTEIETKVDKAIAVPINLPTPPSSENSRDSLPSPPLSKRPSNKQIHKDIENDSGLSDHSISNKSVINEDSNEKVGQLTDSNKNSPDDESEVTQENLRLTRKKFRQKREFILNVSTDKMKTRHSVNVQKSEISNNVGTSVDDKENSGNKSTNIENLKILESPKTTTSPSKRPRAVKKQRFIKKFHKIDSFFQKSEVTKDDEDNNENEVIEIQESPDILPLDNSTEDLLNHALDDPTNDLLNESTNDPSATSKESTEMKKSSLSLVIDEVMSISQQEEQEDENELITLEELYPWMDTSITKLVQKSRRAVEIFKEEQTKFSTYKCMRQKCSFFTTDFEKFKTHTESYDDGHSYCSFCLYKSSSCQELFEHIERSHMYDRYQCNMCMYRASEKAYVEWHQKRFHVCPSGKILKSPTQILMKSVRSKVKEELESEKRMKFVLPYFCKTPGCGKQFFNKNNYKSHLKQESDNPGLTQYIDEICNQLSLLDQTRNKTFKEGYNQCLYCEYGSDNNNDINNHMTDNHPNRLGFICRRIAEAEQICVDEKKDNDDETIENQTRVEYIGISSFKVKIYKGNVDSLTAADVVCAGDGEIVQNKLNDLAEITDEISNDKQGRSTFPIISEILHIDNF